MAQNDIRKTFKSNQFRHENVVPNELMTVEFRGNDPTDLTDNPMRMWARTDTGDMYYTVDGVNINSLVGQLDAGYVNVKWLGAVGNGIANDTLPLTLGLNIPTGYLVIPQGTYRITTNISSIANNLTVEGFGVVTIEGGANSIVDTNVSNVTYKNITFNNFRNIQFSSSSNITFINCKFTNFTTFGVTLLSSCQNVRFFDCEWNVIGNNGVDETFQGQGIRSVDSNGLVVKNCTFHNIYGQGAIWMQATLNINISFNKIYDTKFRGLAWFTGVSSGVVADNDIYNCGAINTTGSGVGCNGMYSAGDTYDVFIIGNRITNVMENGIEGNFSTIDFNIINGTGIDPSGHPTPSTEGIWLKPHPTKITTVRNNHIRNSYGSGIKYFSAADISRLVVVNNIIEDDVKSGLSIAGIDLNAVTSYNDITLADNTVINKPVTILIQNRPTTNFYINDNISVNSGLSAPGNNARYLTSDGVDANLITNREFSDWATPTTLTGWTASSATLSQVVDDNSYIPQITVTAGGFPGRITQNIILPKTTKRYVVKILFKGIANAEIKITPYLIDGVTLNNAASINVTSSTFSSSTFTELSLVASTLASKVQLYIGTTSSTATDYIIVQSINDKIVR